jgi:hypothetical protein
LTTFDSTTGDKNLRLGVNDGVQRLIRTVTGAEGIGRKLSLTIGGGGAGTGTAFVGRYHEIRISTIGTDIAPPASRSTTSFSGREPNLINLWRFENSPSSSVDDIVNPFDSNKLRITDTSSIQLFSPSLFQQYAGVKFDNRSFPVFTNVSRKLQNHVIYSV